jgi:hypothetical protein
MMCLSILYIAGYGYKIENFPQGRPDGYQHQLGVGDPCGCRSILVNGIGGTGDIAYSHLSSVSGHGKGRAILVREVVSLVESIVVIHIVEVDSVSVTVISDSTGGTRHIAGVPADKAEESIAIAGNTGGAVGG